MRRISATEVEDAYSRTGFMPASCCWYIEPDIGINGCACGLGVLVIAEVGEDDFRHMDECISGKEMCLWIAGKLNLDKDYSLGFVDGFDEEPTEHEAPPEYHTGYTDGKAAARAVGVAS